MTNVKHTTDELIAMVRRAQEEYDTARLYAARGLPTESLGASVCAEGFLQRVVDHLREQ